MTGGGFLRAARRIGFGVVAVALLLGTVNLATLLKNYSDDVDAENRPFPINAAVNQTARARTFVATAQGERGGAVIQDSNNHPTSGVWLIVKVRVEATNVPTIIGYAAIRDTRGRVFRATDRLEHQVAGTMGRQLQPGLPVVGEIAFELPRDAATAPTLLLADNSIDQEMDAMLEITLDANSSATVDGWAADTKPTTLMSPTVSA
jgi:hypothetical protein